ncbi:MAG TPA: ChbG/HpnK family deacetylase [Candidatus Dormibacteraeota bacterium]|jgi:hypothetical protein|nr:ChbG/HpnK family deacetylase [Candidatus Dormibacteraeota bacterium]
MSRLANHVLGYPDDARLLIINADDFGIAGWANEATLRAITEGVVRSASLMAPMPAAGEAMRILRDHPDLPFGVHLTVLCDMPGQAWSPLAADGTVPSMVDESGHLYGLERLPEFLERVSVEDLEIEFRAQIEAVIAAGLGPTHLDWHCLHNGGRPDILEMTARLATEYGLALRVTDPAQVERLRRRGLPTDDHDLMDSFDVDPGAKPASYLRMLRELPVGLTEWAVHPGIDGAELRATEPDGWQVRHTDYEFLVSAEAANTIRQEGIELLSYEPLQAIWADGGVAPSRVSGG